MPLLPEFKEHRVEKKMQLAEIAHELSNRDTSITLLRSCLASPTLIQLMKCQCIAAAAAGTISAPHPEVPLQELLRWLAGLAAASRGTGSPGDPG